MSFNVWQPDEEVVKGTLREFVGIGSEANGNDISNSAYVMAPYLNWDPKFSDFFKKHFPKESASAEVECSIVYFNICTNAQRALQIQINKTRKRAAASQLTKVRQLTSESAKRARPGPILRPSDISKLKLLPGLKVRCSPSMSHLLCLN